MDDLRTRIAKVQADHAAAEYSWGVDGCECGFEASDNDEQAAHQADVLSYHLFCWSDLSFFHAHSTSV